MRVLVCGGRDFGDVSFTQFNYALTKEERQLREDQYQFIWAYLSEAITPNDLLITGVARGVEIVAYHWAIINQVQPLPYPAAWGALGMAAGPIRNKQMLDEGKPDLVIAFPGGKGTEHMKKLAQKAGVEIVNVPYP